MTLHERISQELLPRVKKPGQYIGGEWNQLVQPGQWENADLRVAIAFPDTYAIGMSHLGCQILYWICNHTSGVCAERVYAPWIDAEQVMRSQDIPLFTWDTRQPVIDADILAVSLQYEMNFTNLLMILDLAGIPLKSAERDNRHPLVIVGGPQADNPEPIADFVDLVVIGDGEQSMTAILDLCREMKKGGANRRDMILEMARRFEWIYAPSLYEFDYHDDGTVKAMRPGSSCPHNFTPRSHIQRCSTPDLNLAPFPTKPLVPYTEIVHDRISIEIMRGCPQRCRFCHAGYTKRPIGLRSVDKILQIAEQSWQSTGYDEIGLLSLSTADYPDLHELAQKANENFCRRRVNLSIPSLRVDRMLSDIPWMVSSVRKSGLTIAVEAAAENMRTAIRKKVMDGNLKDGVKAAYQAGWNSVKLYFMCGFPGENREDITGIVQLAQTVSEAKRDIRGGPAPVRVAVSWLVPKPHTPLQWAAQKSLDYFNQARILLRSTAAQQRYPVKIKTHQPQRSILEAVLSRGDRRLAATIETAYKLGARMDGWDELFDYSTWLKAFEQTRIDPAFYAHRQRSYDEILPWDHICSGPPRNYLQQQHDHMFAIISSSRSNS
ncbi:MAG: TIGR03960 family B12-binding radical SAM protein [Planctomycetota bacterium]|nr:MAG: TIGR03960 family B12-binding radical SAM protein [Planctomycetota bacterium]